MGLPATKALPNSLRGSVRHDYSQYQFTFTGPAATTAFTASRQPPSYFSVPRTHFYAEPTWWVSPSGLSLSTFPMEPTRSYASSSNGPFQFHLPHRENVASTSRAVFGTNNSEIPSSPSDSVTSSDTTPSPAPEYVHVICNAPLVAPKPLPYHSPTFLQFDLPDDDEDLSHPPYVSRPHKRKREEEDEDEHKFVIMKRRVTEEGRGRWNSEAVYPYFQRPPLRSHAMPTTGPGQYAQRHR